MKIVARAYLSALLAGFTALAVSPPAPPLNLHLSVRVTGIPNITAQPLNQTVVAGQTATFTVTATGEAPLTYQWAFKGLNVGSSCNSYVRSNCQVADNGGQVQVTVSNASGSIHSSMASLTINPSTTNFFVATNGSSSNTGLSTNSPWPLSYALSQSGPSNIITLLPGTYPSIPISQSGITLKSQFKWCAKIIGTPGAHGIWTTGNGNVSNVIVDGFEVSHSYIDGVKFNSPNSTVRNCWIHDSGKGDPNAVTNTNFSYTGQGVSAHNQNGILIEYNLIEHNGMTINNDHGIYINGTNNIVRGNVIRYNLAWGVQVYDVVGDNINTKLYNNLIYGNLAQMTVWSQHGFTNYVFNNTIISESNYCVISDYGHLAVSNNILIVHAGWFPTISDDDGSIVETDFNLVNKSAEYHYPYGHHDVVATNQGFLDTTNGLYWLTVTSPARGMASPSVILPADFFGNLVQSQKDVGAFQFNFQFTADNRILDPSPLNPNYWSTNVAAQ